MKFIIGTSDSKTVKADAMVLADTRALINASSGLGKSWLLRLIAESVASSIQTIIVDPEGEFSTLREKLDILIVSENGDLHADIRSAGLLARKLAETGVSAVLDIYDLPGKEDPWLKRRLFVAEFLNELMNLPKKLWHPMIVMVDEAHQFASEKPTNEIVTRKGQRINASLYSRSAIRSLMSAGRKRGIGGILATQRISKIDKDSIADVRNWFIGGTTLDIDQQRAGDILGMTKSEQVALRDLDPGTFYSFGPAIDGKGVVQFTSGKVQTTHPKPGQRSTIVVPKASTQISGIVEQFGDLPAIAQEEEQTLETLKREAADLKRQLRERPTQVQAKVETKIERVEVPVLPIEQFEQLKASLGDLRVYAGDVKQIAERFEAYPLTLDAMLDTLKAAVDKYSVAATANIARGRNGIKPVPGMDLGRGKDRTAKALVKTESKRIESVDEITGPMQRILDAIAWMESIGIDAPNISTIAFLSGYNNVRSKGFTNPLSSLKVQGLINKPDGRTIVMTDEGRALANYPDPPRTTEELQRVIFSKLPGPQTKILAVLVERGHPYPIDRDELASRCGYTNSRSKGFTNPLSSLKTWGFVEKIADDHFQATRILFWE